MWQGLSLWRCLREQESGEEEDAIDEGGLRELFIYEWR